MSGKSWSVGIIGCGNIAGGYDERLPAESTLTHMGAFRSRGCFEVLAAVDSRPERLKEFARHWSIPQTFSDSEEMLKHVHPDVVSICTPNETHSALVELALRFRPRAIICEKPLALSVKDARRMVQLCEESGVPLLVNYLRRFDESTQSVAGRIYAGEWGKAISARILYTKGVFHNASHGLNLIHDWFGAVRTLKPLGAVERRSDGDVFGSFFLELERCPSVILEAHSAENYNCFEMDFRFESGRVVFPWHGGGIEISKTEISRIVPTERILGSPHEVLPWTQGKALPNAIAALERVMSGQNVDLGERSALRTIELCEEIRNVSQ